jgi:hypothetical protein
MIPDSSRGWRGRLAGRCRLTIVDRLGGRVCGVGDFAPLAWVPGSLRLVGVGGLCSCR